MLINFDNYEHYAIDFLEDTLTLAVKAEMITFLQRNPSIKAEFESMTDLPVLEPNPAIVYREKDQLKQKETRSVFWVYRYAIAAGLAMLLAITWLLNQKTTENTLANDNMAIPKEIESPEYLDQSIASLEGETKSHDQKEKDLIITEQDPLVEVRLATSPQDKRNTLPEKIKTQTVPTEANYLASQVETIEGNKTNIETSTSEVTASIPVQSERLRFSQLTAIESNPGIIAFEQDMIAISPVIMAAIPLQEVEQKKSSWLLNAITRKADGTKVFAFEEIKKALTPTRYRDENVDTSSIDE
ncbi:MAG: hypothetical protein KJP00_00235 [Bacteroidia bacterium]|nr:hypothetical protein [Bacteroidia bacterium]